MNAREFLGSCRGFAGRVPAYLLGAVFTAGLAFSVTSYAVHDIDVFELDNGTTGANAIDESTINDPDAGLPPDGFINPDDWAQNNFPNSLNTCPDGVNSCGYVSGPDVDPANPGGSAFRSLFIQDADGVGNDDDVFVGGGSKDDLDVSQWQWTTSSTPDKDDLLPVGAAAYLEDLTDDNVDNKEMLIYLFGSLFAPNGSAAIGAWLFKKNIGTCGDGTFGVGKEVFNPNTNETTFVCDANQPDDLHTVGDVFVVAETTNGGSEVQMQVFKWVGSDETAKANCVAAKPAGLGGTLESPKKTLCKVLDELNALCTNGLIDDDACGSMNLEGWPTESPDDWGFQSKFPPEPTDPLTFNPAGTDGIDNGDFPETSLFEAGFNFTRLFGDEIGCFNSFLMNTRSSHVVRAQLKDLAMGAFPLCGVSVTKTGDELSKVGDEVTYTYTITNTGSIPLYLDTVVDDVIGDLEADAVANGCATLAPGASCTFDVPYTVQASDPDPLVNVVVVHYNSASDLSGDDQTSTDNHTVNLFQPSITLDKSGDTLSKVGDQVTYVITLHNTSSVDAPDLVCTIRDPLLGLYKQVTLASGANDVTNATYVVQANDPNPLPNTATAECSPEGFPNVLEASDSHSVQLFQPSVTIDKSGDLLSKVGDDVNYAITVANTGSVGSPDLECTVSDPMLGISQPVTLAAGTNHVINASYTVQPGDPDPLVNTASVTCSPQGFPNVLDASDSHTVNLFQPSIGLVKTGDELSKVGDQVTYVITLNNTSSLDSPALECTISDPLLGLNKQVTLASGANDVTSVPYTVPAGSADPLPNTASATCSPIGFPNVLPASDGHSVNLFQPSVTIDKSADCELGVPIGADITYTYLITNTSSADSPALNLTSIVDDKLGSLAADASGAGCGTLAPGASCNFTKVVNSANLPTGTVTNTVNVLYNPAGFPNEITANDSQSCEILLPNPAKVVIEKVLLDAQNVVFNYIDNNLTVAGGAGAFSLTPLFVPVPGQNPASPFAAPTGAPNGFATTIELSVNIPDINQTVQSSVTEDPTLPAFIFFDSLECRVLDDSVDGSSPTGLVSGTTATLTLRSGDFVFCRYVNKAIVPTVGLLIIDEDSIDNNAPHWWDAGVVPGPNNGNEFSDIDVNDQKADEGLRDVLSFFENNVGLTLQLFTGQVGDEGWFAPQFIPTSWNSHDPDGDGLRAYVNGTVPQGKLDKVKDVTPLRAEGLHGLEGGDYCAVVYDSDVSINYGPLNGNLKGANYGIVAFHVLVDGVIKAEGFSSSSLPTVTITILDAEATCNAPLELVNAPKPPTSSEPFDIDPENPTGGYQ